MSKTKTDNTKQTLEQINLGKSRKSKVAVKPIIPDSTPLIKKLVQLLNILSVLYFLTL